jgi:hypothetical protein
MCWSASFDLRQPLAAMGLLPNRRPAGWYDPGRFWSGDRIALVPPFALGHEIAVE